MSKTATIACCRLAVSQKRLSQPDEGNDTVPDGYTRWASAVVHLDKRRYSNTKQSLNSLGKRRVWGRLSPRNEAAINFPEGINVPARRVFVSRSFQSRISRQKSDVMH